MDAAELGRAWELLAAANVPDRPLSKDMQVATDLSLFRDDGGKTGFTLDMATKMEKRATDALELLERFGGEAVLHKDNIDFLKHAARVYIHLAHLRMDYPRAMKLDDRPAATKILARLKAESDELLAGTKDAWSKGRRDDGVVETWEDVYRSRSRQLAERIAAG